MRSMAHRDGRRRVDGAPTRGNCWGEDAWGVPFILSSRQVLTTQADFGDQTRDFHGTELDRFTLEDGADLSGPRDRGRARAKVTGRAGPRVGDTAREVRQRKASPVGLDGRRRSGPRRMSMWADRFQPTEMRGSFFLFSSFYFLLSILFLFSSFNFRILIQYPICNITKYPAWKCKSLLFVIYYFIPFCKYFSMYTFIYIYIYIYYEEERS
jgi:hypothetical protein